MKKQHRKYCEDKHYVLAVGGKVWDEYLQRNKWHHIKNQYITKMRKSVIDG